MHLLRHPSIYDRMSQNEQYPSLYFYVCFLLNYQTEYQMLLHLYEYQQENVLLIIASNLSNRHVSQNQYDLYLHRNKSFAQSLNWKLFFLHIMLRKLGHFPAT